MLSRKCVLPLNYLSNFRLILGALWRVHTFYSITSLRCFMIESLFQWVFRTWMHVHLAILISVTSIQTARRILVTNGRDILEIHQHLTQGQQLMLTEMKMVCYTVIKSLWVKIIYFWKFFWVHKLIWIDSVRIFKSRNSNAQTMFSVLYFLNFVDMANI